MNALHVMHKQDMAVCYITAHDCLTPLKVTWCRGTAQTLSTRPAPSVIDQFRTTYNGQYPEVSEGMQEKIFQNGVVICVRPELQLKHGSMESGERDGDSKGGPECTLLVSY